MNPNLNAAIELLAEELHQLDPDHLCATYGDPARQLDALRRKAAWERVQKDLESFRTDASEYFTVVKSTGIQRSDPALTYEFRKEKWSLIAKIRDKKISGWTATDVFCNAIREFGLERVSQLGLSLCRTPLVSKEPPRQINGYPSYHEVDGWYVVVHSNTAMKVNILNRIGWCIARQDKQVLN